MISEFEYKSNPCRKSAIPYWKMITYTKPENVMIIHDEDYQNAPNNQGIDTQYFRIIHNLETVEQIDLDEAFVYRNIDMNSDDDLMEVVSIINKCYKDIQVNIDQVMKWTRSEVFDESLWVLIIDTKNMRPAALGIAEMDKNVREGALEWIQVLPEYRNCKFGQAIVNKLLERMHDKVDFVTVSGEMDNKTNPEKLYRKCGFQGNDIWHIVVK